MDKRFFVLIIAFIAAATIIICAVRDSNKSEQYVTAVPEPDSEQLEEVEEELDLTPPEPEIDPDSPEGRALERGLPKPPELDVTSWELILVNADNSIEASFVPDLGVARCKASSTEQDARIADVLSEYASACEAEGLPVYLSSGYRSYDKQAANLQRKLNQGYSYEDAVTIVQPPGCSEHQTGLCCDITDVYRASKAPWELELTPTYQWLYAHCAEYGFILRYPDGKTDITGIMYEPWHFRYVGEEAAKYIMENNLCLEEFLALYI